MASGSVKKSSIFFNFLGCQKSKKVSTHVREFQRDFMLIYVCFAKDLKEINQYSFKEIDDLLMLIIVESNDRNLNV